LPAWAGRPASGGESAVDRDRRAGHGIVVLTVSTTGIARIVVFGDPGLFGRFGLPPTWR
jgi:RNA polymerase sigma-70 factor, ECF subfamily